MKIFTLFLGGLMMFAFTPAASNAVSHFNSTPCSQCWDKADAYGDEIARGTGSQMEGQSAFLSKLYSCRERNNCDVQHLDQVVVAD